MDIGAIPNSTKDCLLEYLLELEASHSGSQASLKRIPFATARRFLLTHEQRLSALIKAIKNVLNPPRQHGSFVNNLPDTHEPNNSEAEDDASGEEDDGEQSPSHGDSNPSPTPPTEHSSIQYVQLPLPKNQGQNDLKQDRQSGGRGGNHR